MLEIVAKVIATSVLVVAASEASKRSVLMGAILASLPLTSLLAMTWLWLDTRDPERVAALSRGIFWLILPSFILLLALPMLLRRGVPFAGALAIGVALTVAGYLAMVAVLRHFGIEI